ncbi:TetR/AcrR family transcriptional regulator [Amycolatopsis sp. cmx-8-4]|uniref:TetR/AcrR family transcriptional regulator n=1 Tax=Amycolatopsis sp. cmx-8-4 TaxID=2790947 RepID=UPI00397D971C
MGNKEDLLAGALECLRTRGWTRTTVRDIAEAAGVNHAAIGYHFGSRDALLTEAFTQAMDTWGAETTRAVEAATISDAGRGGQYEVFWRSVLASYAENRWLWLVMMEVAVQTAHSPTLRDLMATSLREGRIGLAAGLLGIPQDTLDSRSERSLGSLQMALVSGIFIQWVLDTEATPDEHEISDGIRTLADQIRLPPELA